MKSEIKTNLDGLKAGMYVSRLDIPWIETSFLLEGLLINSDDDIKKLAELCKYVYVDIDRGDSPHPDFIVQNSTPGNSKKEGKTSSKQKVKPKNQPGTNNNDDTSSHKTGRTSKPSRSAKPSESLESSKQANQRSSQPSPDKKPQAKRQLKGKPAQNDDKQNQPEYNDYLETVSTRRKRTYKEKTTFPVELKTATTIHEKLSDDFKLILSELNKGKSLDLHSIIEGITDL
ncbi:MAG: DUF3391 domain-containing protein, partial [Gammaproteobacteria bacterium]|nr:DUF3391 domain-containing protein [Gammaproteobacteria bacterium]